MHSRMRWRMKKAVFKLTEHLWAVSLKDKTSTWHSANSIQVARSSFVVEKTLLVRAVKVLKQDRQRQRWEPSASWPFSTTCRDPQRGQRTRSDSGRSSQYILKNSSSISFLSDSIASRLSSLLICGKNRFARDVTISSTLTSSSCGSHCPCFGSKTVHHRMDTPMSIAG